MDRPDDLDAARGVVVACALSLGLWSVVTMLLWWFH